MTREVFRKQLPQLVKNYSPAPDVSKLIGNIRLLMVIGPSGAGKTTLIQESGLPFVASDTTREPRPQEREGIDFYFRSDYDKVIQDIKSGRFVQVAVGASGDFYSTKATSYPQSGFAAMPVLADVIPIFRRLGFANTISVFITPPSYQEWMRRMNTHKMSKDQLAKRLSEAKRSFKFALHDQKTHFILNDEIPAATYQLKELIKGKIDAEREQKTWLIATSLADQLH